MLERQLPERFAPHKLAINRGQISGDVALSRCPRLQESLLRKDSSVHCEVQGEVDAMHRQLLHVQVQGDLYVACQTCMGELHVPVQAQFTLHVVKEESQFDEASDFDPLIAEEDDASLLDVVEDELILSLPVVANHEPGQCGALAAHLHDENALEPETDTRENPFAVLVGLKKHD